jgi:hypothetical protein
MVSAGDEVSASLLPDVRQPAIWGCTGEPAVLPQLRRGSPPSVAHGRDIDNFLSIGRSQAPRQVAEKFGVSLRSVKRLLRQRGVRREGRAGQT